MRPSDRGQYEMIHGGGIVRAQTSEEFSLTKTNVEADSDRFRKFNARVGASRGVPARRTLPDGEFTSLR